MRHYLILSSIVLCMLGIGCTVPVSGGDPDGIGGKAELAYDGTRMVTLSVLEPVGAYEGWFVDGEVHVVTPIAGAEPILRGAPKNVELPLAETPIKLEKYPADAEGEISEEVAWTVECPPVPEGAVTATYYVYGDPDTKEQRCTADLWVDLEVYFTPKLPKPGTASVRWYRGDEEHRFDPAPAAETQIFRDVFGRHLVNGAIEIAWDGQTCARVGPNATADAARYSMAIALREGGSCSTLQPKSPSTTPRTAP